MKLYELNPHIRYARIHNNIFHTRKGLSICYDARIFFFEVGRGELVANGEKYNITNKVAIYLPPLTRYRFLIDGDSEPRVIILDFDLVSTFADITSSLGTANPQNFDESRAPVYELPQELSRPIVKSVPEISSLLTQCAENFITRRNLYRERSSALLKLSLLELCARAAAYPRTPLVERVLEYVHENYAKQALTNEEIAEVFNYHPNHLNRMIKRETGKTLREYVIYYRLQIAKDRLLTTEMSISEVAWSTGFCSAAYFVKTFKEKIGMTPKEYRRRRLHTEI